MSGLYGFYSENKISTENHFERFFSSSLPNIINEEFCHDNFLYGRSVLNKFTNDRFLHEDNQFIIGIEGIVYNYENPKKEIPKAFQENGLNFIEELEGGFSGFIFDKQQQKLHIFTDLLATRSLFYYVDVETNSFFFASELKVLTSFLSDLNIPFNTDSDGFNCLLSMGYMLDDLTLIKEIKSLRSSTLLSYDLSAKSITKKKNFRFNTNPKKISFDEAIEKLDSLLINAVNKEWNKDKDNGFSHLTFLSGGLDARVNALLANETGFKNITSLNFSQTGAPDQIIAKEIADGESFDYRFFKLDEGNYLLSSFENLVAGNGGLTCFHDAAHMYTALQSLPLSKFGLAHSGQIGGVLFGSFTRPHKTFSEEVKKLGNIYNPDILAQISVLPEIKKRYQNSIETYSYEQRQINNTINGDRLCAHIVDIQSPFYDKELIQFCISLPDELKVGKKLYTEWIRKKHPNMFSYTWDEAGIRPPQSKLITRLAILINKYYGYAKRIMGHDRSPMNPYSTWINNNHKLQKEINDIYNANLHLISEKWLINNIENTFKLPSEVAKFNALTAILAYKLHFKQ